MEFNLSEFSLPYPDISDKEMSDKKVRVLVPPHKEGERLPVIYMSDGQNLFDEESAPYGCWHTQKIIEDEIKNCSRGAVIVGIHHGGNIKRFSELAPMRFGFPTVPPGTVLPDEVKKLKSRAEVFDEFLIHSVMPYINERYPVLTDRDNTAFCGSSMGGLFAYYTALEHSDIFSAAGVFSPAFFYESTDPIISLAKEKTDRPLPLLYMYSGAGDELEKFIYTAFTAVCEELRGIGYPEDKLKCVARPELPHHESAWEEIFRDFVHIFLNGK